MSSLFELNKRFKYIDSDIIKTNYPRTLNFLNEALDFFNLNVKEFNLIPCAMFNSPRIIFIPTLNFELAFYLGGTKLSADEMDFVVLHELQHIIQFKEGKITVKDDWLYWKGRKMDEHKEYFDREKYSLLEWEKEANFAAFNCPLFDKSLIQKSSFVANIFSHYDFHKVPA